MPALDDRMLVFPACVTDENVIEIAVVLVAGSNPWTCTFDPVDVFGEHAFATS